MGTEGDTWGQTGTGRDRGGQKSWSAPVQGWLWFLGFGVKVRQSVELGSGTCSEPGSGFRVWSGNRGSGAREARSQATVTAPKP